MNGDTPNPLGSEGVPDPRSFDVGAQSQGGTPPPVGAPAAAAPQQAPNPAQAMAAATQAADVQHHSVLGKAFRSLMGNEVNYQIDPQTGKMVQTQTEQKPGQLWRSIIAATILGGATAARNKAPGFIQGAAEGGEAVIDKGQQQDQIKRQQAQQQFEDQLKAKSANTEEDLKRAQIAFHNAQTLNESYLARGRDFAYHKEVAEHGKSQIDPYVKAGVPFFKKDVSEHDMLALDKDAMTEHSKYLWEPTGTIVTDDGKGGFSHALTYSAVDPKGDITITPSQISDMEKDGIDKYLGNQWKDVLTNKTLPAGQYMALTQKQQELHNKISESKKAKMDEEKEQSLIALQKAQAAHFYAEANRIRKEGGEKAQKEHLYTEAADALDKLRKDGKGFEDLPTKYQDALTDHSQVEAKEKADMLKTMIASGQGGSKEAGDLYQEWRNLSSVHAKTQTDKPKETAPAGKPDMVTVKVGDNFGQIPAGKLDDFLRDNPDAKTGSDVSKEHVENQKMEMISGKTVKMNAADAPKADDLFLGQSLYTDGKGSYIIRDSGFKNSQWKLVADGTQQAAQ